MFLDCAVYNSRMTESRVFPDRRFRWLDDKFSAFTATTGPSLRYRGFKAELSVGLSSLFNFLNGRGPVPSPSVHFGMDVVE
jgi:hypothetical protein